MNVFQVRFVPDSLDERFVSCAADGEVRLHHVNHERNEKLLWRNEEGMVNSFAFKDAKVLYAASFFQTFSSYGGSVVQIDLREKDVVVVLDSGKDAVKVVMQTPWNEHVLAVGVGTNVVFVDVRKRGTGGESAVFEKFKFDSILATELKLRTKIGPFFPNDDLDKNLLLSFTRTAEKLDAPVKKLTARSRMDFSVCSLEASKIDRELLVSYQGDLIYRVRVDKNFAMATEGANETPSARRLFTPVQAFAGHINEQTFLKRASYFGPNEEYVVAGGDDGNVFVWDTKNGDVVMIKKGDGSSTRRGIVNGVCPSPCSNSFVSYGLDQDAKLWLPKRGPHDNGNDYDTDLDDAGHKQAAQYYADEINRYKCGALQKNRQALLNSQPAFTLATQLIRIAFTLVDDDNRDEHQTSFVLDALVRGKLNPQAEWIIPDLFPQAFKRAEEFRIQGNEHFHGESFPDAKRFYFASLHLCFQMFSVRNRIRAQFADVTDQNLCPQIERERQVELFKKMGSIPPDMFDWFGKRSVLFRIPDSFFKNLTLDALTEIVFVLERASFTCLTSSLNTAQTGLKLRDFQLAKEMAYFAVQMDGLSVKGHFRLAQALRGLGKRSQAVEELNKCLRLDGGNTALVRDTLAQLRKDG